MNRIIYTLLFIVNKISFLLFMLLSCFTCLYEFIGAIQLERLFKKLHIPLTFNSLIIVGCISLLIFIGSYLLLKKYG